jgi:4-amino-4-deoxychorismate lyase
MQLSFVNGVVCDCIGVRDRGLAYGDGLFETIAVIKNKLHNWDRHYQRLKLGAQKLSMDCPQEQHYLDIFEQVKQQNLSADTLIFKIILTRGAGGHGYLAPKQAQTNSVVVIHKRAQIPQSYYQKGIDIRLMDIKLSEQSELAGIKHLNRLEQVIARNRLENCYQEAVLCNQHEQIIEGISSNIFFIDNNNRLCTPKISNCGVAGTLRDKIIKHCRSINLDISVSHFNISELTQSRGIFFSNSIIGIWPVHSYQYYQHIFTFTEFHISMKKLMHDINSELEVSDYVN